MEEIVVRYFHFIAFITLSCALVGKHLLLAKEMDSKDFKKLFIVDIAYGVSAVLTLSFGLLLWLVVGKPANFYSSNGIFHLKLSIFAVIALLSVFTTAFILKNRKVESEIIFVPSYIIILVRMEMVLLTIIPLLAILMARGLDLI